MMKYYSKMSGKKKKGKEGGPSESSSSGSPVHQSEAVTWFSTEDLSWAGIFSEVAPVKEVKQSGNMRVEASVANYNLGLEQGFSERYEKVKKIGKGDQGSVYKCRDLKTKEMFAVKIIKKKKFVKESVRMHLFQKEIQVLKALKDCHQVINLIEVLEDKKRLYIVQELCRGGELLKQIAKRKIYSEADAADLLRQMFELVAQIHLHGVVHRDIKPQNFLFRHEDGLEICAVDFGFSEFFEDGHVFKEKMGSPMYVAPEVLWGKGYGPEIDVWGVGVIMYIMLSGRPPFRGKTEHETLSAVMFGEIDLYQDPWHRISEPAKDLLRKVLERSPEMRITASQALSHPWLAEGSASPTALDFSVARRMQHFANWTAGKKILMSEIARRLEPPHIRDMRDQFVLVDKNQDGLITVAELEEAISKVRNGCNGDRVVSKERLERIFQELDMDHNGLIDYAEFIGAVVNWHQLRTQDARALHKCALEMFKSIDMDGNGYVDPEDLKLYAGGGTDMTEVIAEADRNGDGLVNFQDFWTMVRQTTCKRLSVGNSLELNNNHAL